MKRNIIRKPFKYSFTNATLFLIIINILVYILTIVRPNLYNYLSMCPALVYLKHAYWQFITHMFVHGNLMHILFNMFALFCFGISVERLIGTKEFLLFYFVCGILSGIASYFVYFFTGNYYVFLMGASGAIYSVMFAYAVFFPRSIISIWGIIPIPAPIAVLIFAIIEIVSQFFGGDGVAHLTHLFGLIFAYIYIVIRMGIHPIKVWKENYRK